MATVIAGYIPDLPEEHWAVIGAFVRAAVADCDQRTPYSARELMKAAARHVQWCVYTAGLPLERDYVFHRETIAEYAARGCPQMAPASAGNRRSQLLRMSELLLPPAQRTARLAPFPASAPVAPYTSAEQTALRSWAAAARTDYMSVNARLLLALGFGAGLSAAEVGGVRVRHLHVDADGVQVQVEGARPRLVPVLADWEPALAAFRESAMFDDMFVFRPRRAGPSRNLVANFLAKTNITGVRPSLQRMRVTWIVTHLSAGSPIKAVMQAAGVDSLEALTRYLPFVPDVDPDTYRVALRAALHGDGGGAP